MAIRRHLLQIVHDVRESYWFLPGRITGASVALGLGFVLIDTRIGHQWLGRYEWFYGSRPEGARAMLSTIAGSTITVAGVVFSITLAAVTYASGQFGPRLLGNFTRDRANQATLGVFIGTYLYCLVVLRTIRSEVGRSLRAIRSGLGVRLLRRDRPIGFWEDAAENIEAGDLIIEIVPLSDDGAEARPML